MPLPSRDLPNERTRDLHHSLFGSDDEYDYSSPRSARDSSRERVDDVASRHHIENCGTGKGTTLKRNELKPWRLPEQLINSSSHETSQHHRIPLFDASELHILRFSVKNFRAEEDFYLDAFFKHRGTTVTKSVTRSRFWRRDFVRPKRQEFWARSVASKLHTVSVKFEKRTPTGARYRMHRLSRAAGIPCFTWGDTCARCVDNSQRAQRDVYSLSSPWKRAHISAEMRDAIANLQSVYKLQ